MCPYTVKLYIVLRKMHDGEILEKAIRNSGYSIKKIAEKAKVSRQYIYKLFDCDVIDNDTLQKFGEVLGYDFSSVINHFKSINIKTFQSNTCEEKLQEITSKYIRLLEDYNQLLKSISS